MTFGWDEVVELAKKKLNKDYPDELIRGVYEHNTKFIKRELRRKPYLAVFFPGLGTAYYKYVDVARFARNFSGDKLYKTNSSIVWRRRKMRLEEYFNTHQPQISTLKTFVFLPYIRSTVKRDSIKYGMERVESNQNSL